MDLTHALHVFRLYCFQLKKDPFEAESMLLSDQEKQAIQELKDVIREYADLIVDDRGKVAGKAA